MHFSVIPLSSLIFCYAFAQGIIKTATYPLSTGIPNAPSTDDSGNTENQVKVHVVRVGANKATTFEPNKITAQVGEMVQFQFADGNHTVAQSTFDQPCVPISMVDPKISGFYSGYMPTSAASDMLPTYTIMISNMKPVWIYCSQGRHCEKGMQMVINENSKANATRTLENFSALAAKAVTVQMKEDENPTGKTPPSPSDAAPKSSEAPSKTSDKGSDSGSSSRSGSSSSNSTDSNDSKKPVSGSGKNTANIIVSALVGLLVFAIVI
ncbi:putative GPI-anchored cupredoxin [Erysiphe neolycopersici]|uniref:Putative GPI-anchored cupredoxin n=1 Tax=Erysiphe neolycopersici TaxID=212602 RepID=A0A420HX82_9PEZI|nr:putative GPI-anchored cupredoxin [Erysiphe neolycopersici]